MNTEDEQEVRGLVALSLNGGPFRSYAASHILSIASCWTEVRYWILYSQLRHGDPNSVLQFLRDWQRQDYRPSERVSKFVPGQHYHTLGEKFDTLQESINHLWQQGYRYGGLTEKHVYRPE